jgi:hypothetical protein
MIFTGNICIASREISKILITNRTNTTQNFLHLLWHPKTYYLTLKEPTTGSYLEPVLTRHSFRKIHPDIILLSQEIGISPLDDQKSLLVNSASYRTLFFQVIISDPRLFTYFLLGQNVLLSTVLSNVLPICSNNT